MTPENCIALVDTLVPNAVPEILKQRWLAELEGYLLVDVCHHDPRVMDLGDGTEEPPTLSVPFPYDRVYWTYLAAMIIFCQGDVTRYSEASDLFEKSFENYAQWYQRERRS